MIVLDSSAAVEALRGTDESRAIQDMLKSDEEVVSCELFRAEIASVMRKFTRTEGIDITEANLRFSDAIDLVNRFYPLEGLQAEALAESIRLDHSVYDMFYFVLARRTRGALFTTDMKLVCLCEKHGVNCMTLIDY